MHLSLNVVLHRMNLDYLNEIIQLAEEMGAERLELANTQYYNWALLNQERLLPSWDQIQRAREIYESAKTRLKKKMEDDSGSFLIITHRHLSLAVGGMGAIGLTVAPNGAVLPCPTAGIIEGLFFENVREASLRHIWYKSESFSRFRGDAWMPEPCHSCELRHQDGGGCRCQAFALTGDAYATDPVCQWAPKHHLIEKAIQEANSNPMIQSSPMIYRRHITEKPVSKRRIKK